MNTEQKIAFRKDMRALKACALSDAIRSRCGILIDNVKFMLAEPDKKIIEQKFVENVRGLDRAMQNQ